MGSTHIHHTSQFPIDSAVPPVGRYPCGMLYSSSNSYVINNITILLLYSFLHVWSAAVTPSLKAYGISAGRGSLRWSRRSAR